MCLTIRKSLLIEKNRISELIRTSNFHIDCSQNLPNAYSKTPMYESVGEVRFFKLGNQNLLRKGEEKSMLFLS